MSKYRCKVLLKILFNDYHIKTKQLIEDICIHSVADDDYMNIHQFNKYVNHILVIKESIDVFNNIYDHMILLKDVSIKVGGCDG